MHYAYRSCRAYRTGVTVRCVIACEIYDTLERGSLRANYLTEFHL